MSFCSNITREVITNEQQVLQDYPNSVLPQSTSFARITNGANEGRLTAASLESIYNSLKSSGKLVAQKGAMNRLGDTNVSNERNNERNYAKLSTVGTTELQTIRSIGNEYCFYYVRYKYTLEVLFDKLMTASAQSQSSEQVRQGIANTLTLAKKLNSKLNDILQITNYLAKKRASEMQEQNTEINALNSSINSTFETLKKHDKMLKDETSVSELRKSMVEYSQEKNLSAQNLLALYGFLNLVAIGLLFYISRS